MKELLGESATAQSGEGVTSHRGGEGGYTYCIDSFLIRVVVSR